MIDVMHACYLYVMLGVMPWMEPTMLRWWYDVCLDEMDDEMTNAMPRCILGHVWDFMSRCMLGLYMLIMPWDATNG